MTKGDIVSLKLINGEEIIARYETETVDDITVEKPLAITVGPKGLGMMPWMFLANKDTVTLSKAHIFAHAPTKKDAADQYLQGTTGIALR